MASGLDGVRVGVGAEVGVGVRFRAKFELVLRRGLGCAVAEYA